MNVNEQLRALEEQIAQLEVEQQALTTQSVEAQTEISAVSEQESSILGDVNKKLEEFRAQLMADATQKIVSLRERQKELNEAKAEAQLKVSSVEKSIQDLKRDAAKLLEAAQAEQTLDELKTRLADIFETTKWGKAIRPYQQNDVLTIAHTYMTGGSGVLNANPMGLGKTFETAATIDIVRHLFQLEHNRPPRILFLTRQKLVGEAARELHRWTDTIFVPMAKIPNAGMRKKLVEMSMINNMPLVTNYEALASTPYIMDIEWDIVIGDEIHRIKGGAKRKREQRSRVFNTMEDLLVPRHPIQGYFLEDAKRPFFLALSGSPVQNTAEEMWCYLYLLRPDLFPTLKDFDFYTQDVWDDRVGKYVKHARMDKIMSTLKGQMIRNDPDEVGVQRPTKEHVYNYLDLSERPQQEALYKQVTEELFLKLDKMDPDATMSIGSVLPLMTRQWQTLVWPQSIKLDDEHGNTHTTSIEESVKIDRAMELIEDITNEGENVVVWSIRFKEPLHELRRRCKELNLSVEILDGDTKDPDQVSEDFRQNKIQVLLANAQAAAEGFNWQRDPSVWPGGARKAIFLDRWWNPEFNKQCEDRIVRPTADNVIPPPVEVYVLHVENSFDDLIKIINDVKEGVIDPIINYEGLKPKDLKKLLGYAEEGE